MLNHKDIEKFDNFGKMLKETIDKLESEVSKIDSKEKGFLLSSISSIKDKIKNGGDINEDIDKLNNYASNR